MNVKKWFQKMNVSGFKLKTGLFELNFDFSDKDKEAAWELYVELITRVVTQSLEPDAGDEKTALKSVAGIFQTTRNILKAKGPECLEFTKLSVIILNHIIRPFTSKWHKQSVEGGFLDNDNSQEKEFRADLLQLQQNMRNYTGMLAELIGLKEDITDLNSLEKVETDPKN